MSTALKNKTTQDEIDSLSKRVKLLEDILLENNSLIDKVNNIHSKINKMKNLDSLLERVQNNENLIITLNKTTINNQNDSNEPLKAKNNEVQRAFVCKKCKLTFNGKRLLKEHIKLNHSKTITCNDCSEEFDAYWKLEMHIKDHNKENDYSCDVCDKSFFLEWRLKKHI